MLWRCCRNHPHPGHRLKIDCVRPAQSLSNELARLSYSGSWWHRHHAVVTAAASTSGWTVLCRVWRIRQGRWCRVGNRHQRCRQRFGITHRNISSWRALAKHQSFFSVAALALCKKTMHARLGHSHKLQRRFCRRLGARLRCPCTCHPWESWDCRQRLRVHTIK